MSEQLWYIYQNSQQLGPFAVDQIKQLFSTKMISQSAYLFKVGWKDWCPLEDCLDQIGVSGHGDVESSPARREGAPRASVVGRVVVHNNGQLTIGTGVNISGTGIFVETEDELFTLGERIKLTVRCEGVKKPFNVNAEVVRFNTDKKYPLGYGLRFEDIDSDIQKEIEDLVSAHNQNELDETVSK